MISGASISSTPLSGEDGGSVVSAGVVETGNAVDTVASRLIAFPSVHETGSLTDTVTPFLFLHRSVSETLSAADHLSVVHDLIVNETLHAVDTTNRGLAFTAAVSETLRATDTVRSGIRPHVHEVLHATDLIAAGINGHRSLVVRESLDADDTVTTANNKYAKIVETLSPHVTVSSSLDGVFKVAVKETLSAADTATPARSIHAIIAELLHGQDNASGQTGIPGIWHCSVSETLHAAENIGDPQTFSSPGIFFWGYQWAYNQGFQKLAVWCSGLDCGDWPVNPDGSVFVPWQSDPDQLFTPAYLINLSNSPPEEGFGGTDCNIDLYANDGSIERIVVDLAIGLPYTSQVQLLRMNASDQSHSQYGPSLAETRRLHMIGAQLANAGGLSFGTTVDNLLPAIFTQPDGTPMLMSDVYTGVYWSPVYADYNFDNMLMAQVERPYPCTIVAMTGFFKTFDRE